MVAAPAALPDLDLELTPSHPAAPPPAMAPIEIPEEADVPAELAPMHEFVPPAASTGHRPDAVVAAVAPPAPAHPAAVPQGGRGVVAGMATGADGGEAALREALSQASREVIERVVWEVVPQLAETIIRENLDRLAKARQG